MQKLWYAQNEKQCLHLLNTTLHGLSTQEANKRLSQYGVNDIPISTSTTLWKKIIGQFHNVLIYILLAAALITALLQQWADASVIFAVVLLNALIGYIQEGKAEKAVQALRQMLSLQADVIRDGMRKRVLAQQLAPGDIVYLSSGDKVPADMRLLKTNNCQINEALLTGESLPQDKQSQLVDNKALLTERHSMAYSGTYITSGNAVGVVVNTGRNTEIGRISSLLTAMPKLTTPLLKQLTVFARWLALIIICFSLAIFCFGIFLRQYPLEEMFMAAVAIAVSIMPEGLPAIITIALAVGVTRMAKRQAIIRQLPAVETLSSVTVICTDKTGTLTKNELTVKKIVLVDKSFDVSGSGYNDEGRITYDNHAITVTEESGMLMLLRAAALCNEASLTKLDGDWQLAGNPMDGSLLALALKGKLDVQQEIIDYPQIDAIPFDSQHKFMASLHQNKNRGVIFIKGAPEPMMSRCQYQLLEQQRQPLDKAYWVGRMNELAGQGMRVMGLAYRPVPVEQKKLSFDDVSTAGIFLGLVGIMDPPREKAAQAVADCYRAGIQVKMVTGDHSLTAKSVAKQVGITNPRILSGANIDALTDEQLADIVEDVDIYARTLPEHKVRLINALRRRQHVVAMTGDGVNDAPALKSAEVGIAMGVKGSDVAKEAAEIVLADDNFASIRDAIKEARNVYNNLKKTLIFLLPNDGGEGCSVFFAILFGYTLPITPLQILWVNMVTAITLGLALAFEKPEEKLMASKPRLANEALLSKFLLWRIAFVSFLFVSCMFGLFIYEINHGTSVDMARTMVVNVLVCAEAVYLINCRRIHGSVLNKEGLFGSLPVLTAIALVVLLQLAFTYLPIMQYFFQTQAMTASQWLPIIVLSLLIFFSVEGEKFLVRRLIKSKWLSQFPNSTGKSSQQAR